MTSHAANGGHGGSNTTITTVMQALDRQSARATSAAALSYPLSHL
jgi:hypothetical protein